MKNDHAWRTGVIRVLESELEKDDGLRNTLQYVYQLKGFFLAQVVELTSQPAEKVFAQCELLRDLGLLNSDPPMEKSIRENRYCISNKGLALEELLRNMEIT